MAKVTYLKTVSDGNLKTVIQRISNLLNKDIIVHSGDRDFVPPGGSKNSLHKAKRAADFHISGVSDGDGFAFCKQNMNSVFDATEAYEFIHHGFYTGTGTQNPQTGAGGQHLHIGHYGRGSYVTFKVEGLTRATKNQYSPTKVLFTSPNGIPVQPEQALNTTNAGANGSPANISESVGKYGKNQINDVIMVQYFLNLANRNMTEANMQFQRFNSIVQNGICAEDTIQAITIFQRDIMGWKEPDGLVEPGGKTLQMLYIAAYNPSDETLLKLNRAKIMIPETNSQEWNGVLAWGNYRKSPNITDAFISKTMRICQELNIKNPSWLMTVMAFETKYTFAPNKKNEAGSTGTGLIQFMKETIDGRIDKKTGKLRPGLGAKLGITHSQLAGMTAERQLDVVKAYFQQFGGKPAQAKDVDDLYFLVLNPVSFGKADDDTVFQSGTAAYRDNKGLDADKDGKVSIGETAQKIRETYQEGLAKYGLKIK